MNYRISLSDQDWSFLLDGATSLAVRMTEVLSEFSEESDHRPPIGNGTVLRLQLGDTEWSVNTDTEAKLWISVQSISESSVNRSPSVQDAMQHHLDTNVS